MRNSNKFKIALDSRFTSHKCYFHLLFLQLGLLDEAIIHTKDILDKGKSLCIADGGPGGGGVFCSR